MKKLISVMSSLCLAATSLFSSFPAFKTNTASADGDIILDLVPSGVEYELKGNNNVAKVQPGDTVKVNYTVKNDAVTSGMEFTFDISKFTYVADSFAAGRAYSFNTELNDAIAGQLTFTMAANETATARDGATIVSFSVKAPTTEGTYSIGLKSGARAIVAGYDKGVSNPYVFHGLSLVVGDASEESSQPDGDEIVLDLVAANKTNTFDGSNNVVEVAAGETVKVNYTVKNDSITSGMEFTFDVSKVSYVADSFAAGRAYSFNTELNDAIAGQLTFTMAANETATARDGATIVTFSVKAPASGSATIGLKSGARAIVAGYEKGVSNPYVFHGLTLKVTDSGDETTTTPKSTEPDPDDIILDLVAANKTNTFDGANNVVEVAPGETVKVNYTVKNDQVTSGMEFTFDLAKATYVADTFAAGRAYSFNTELNDAIAGQLTFTMAANETATARDGATIVTFTVTAPQSGSTTIGLKSGARAIVAGYEKGVSNPYVFHGLTLKVTDSGDETTTTPKSTEPDPDDIILDLVAANKTNTFDGTNNVVEVAPGETVKVNYTVKNDSITSGMEFTFDLAKATYVADTFAAGRAYSFNTELNDAIAGQLTFTMAANETATARDGATIVTFTVTAPQSGSTTIGLKSGARAIVAGYEKGVSNPYVFHGLTLKVTDSGDETTTTPKSTEPDPDDIILDLIAANKTNTFDGTNNVVEVAPGETVKVNYTVKNDQVTSGMEFTFDLAKATYVADTFAAGRAYSFNTELNDAVAGQLTFTMAANETATARDGATIVTFTVTAPQSGSTTIGLKDGARAIVAGYDKGVSNPYVFHGLTLKVVEQSDTTTTTSSEPVQPGSAKWIIDTKTVEAGAKVALPVIVTDAADGGAAGFRVSFKYDDALTFNGFTWGDQYTKTEDAVLNKTDAYVVWASPNAADQAANGDVLYLNFTAPAAAGEYPVEFVSLEVINTDGQALTIDKENGAVIVEGETTTTTTTTSEPVQPGSAKWVIDTKTVAAGAEVALPVIVTDAADGGAAGFRVNFKYDDALTFNGFTWGDQYTKSEDAVLNKTDAYVVWASPNAADQAANGDVLYLNFTAPAAAGEYPVEFVSLEVINTDGQALTIDKENGAVIVEGTTTTTTTTSGPIQPGSAKWVIDTKTVAAGAEVALPVIVTDAADGGAAGFRVNFKYDDALTFTGFSWGDQYTKTEDAVLNKTDAYVVWASPNAADQVANGDVLYLNFVAPDAAGEYPVEFISLEVINTDGQALTIDKENGAVIVEATTTTTTITTTTTTETTTSTTVTTTSTTDTTTTTTDTTSTTTGTTTTESTTTTTGTTTTESTTTTTGTTTTDSTTTTTGTTTTESTTTTTGTTTTESTTTTTGTTTTESTTTTTGTTTTGTTTTDTTDTTTTTTGPVVPGAVKYDIDDVLAHPGTVVKVPVYVNSDSGTAGFRMQFDIPEGFSISGITWGDAYTNNNGEAMWNATDKYLIWADENGNAQVAPNGSVILYLDVVVPEDAEPGKTYPITFVDGTVIAYDGKEQPMDTTTDAGSVTIVPNDTVVYGVDDTEAEPGQSTDIPVNVILDPGTSSFEITLDIPDDLTINDITFDPEYLENGTFDWDPETKTLKWVRNDGSDFTPDGKHNIANINVTVPESAEPGTTYTIGAKDVKATDKDGNPLNYTFNEGTLTVKPKQNETTTTTTVTTTTTETTSTDTTTTTTATTTTETTTSTTDTTTTDTTTTTTGTTTTDTTTTTTGTTTTDTTTTTTGTTTTETTTSTTETTTTNTTTTTTGTTTTETTTSTTETTTTNTTTTTTGTTTTNTTTTNTTTTTTGTTTTNSTTTNTTTTTTGTTTTNSTTTNTTTTTTGTTTTSTGTTTTTTNSTTTTTGTTTTCTTTTLQPGQTAIVTSYTITYDPPVRVNYWSHDDRTFKESGGLKQMNATLKVTKTVLDYLGQVLSTEEKSLDITAYTNPEESLNSPKKIWDAETAASLGKTEWTYEEELTATHANKYPMTLYYTYDSSLDPDFDINNGAPYEFGSIKIYIGVKGDFNLDNEVDITDAQLTLQYYTWKLALKPGFLSNDPEFAPVDDPESGLIFFLVNVDYRDGRSGTDPLTKPQTLDINDAQDILAFYTYRLAQQYERGWEYIVGYDYLDYFYGDQIQ